jgi:hypothetical protein
LTRKLSKVLNVLLSHTTGLPQELNAIRLPDARPREPFLCPKPCNQKLAEVAGKVTSKPSGVNSFDKYLRNQIQSRPDVPGQDGL